MLDPFAIRAAQSLPLVVFVLQMMLRFPVVCRFFSHLRRLSRADASVAVRIRLVLRAERRFLLQPQLVSARKVVGPFGLFPFLAYRLVAIRMPFIDFQQLRLVPSFSSPFPFCRLQQGAFGASLTIAANSLFVGVQYRITATVAPGQCAFAGNPASCLAAIQSRC